MCSQHPSDTGFGGFKRWAVEVDVRVFYRQPGRPLTRGKLCVYNGFRLQNDTTGRGLTHTPQRERLGREGRMAKAIWKESAPLSTLRAAEQCCTHSGSENHGGSFRAGPLHSP